MDNRTEEQPALAAQLALLAAETRTLGARPESQDILERLSQIATQLDCVIDRLAKRKTGH